MKKLNSQKVCSKSSPDNHDDIEMQGVSSLSKSNLKDGGAVKKKSDISSSAEANVTAGNSPKRKSGKSRSRKKKPSKVDAVDGKQDFNSPTKESKHSTRYSSSDTSELFSDFVTKMNSSDNMRNNKQSRQASVPNELKEDNQSSPISKHSQDKKQSKFRSKTPEHKMTAKKSNSAKKSTKFEPYIPLFQVQQGLKRGEFIEGALRINPRNYEDAYVNSPDGKMDIYIGGMHARNRAMNGDIVCVQINPKQEWKVLCEAIKDYQERSGDVVYDTIIKSESPSPCKIHTPDKFRSRPVSSNSWDSACGERMPDTLEILGIDKLTQQFKDIAMSESRNSKTRSKKKTKLGQNSKDSSEKNSTSYSQSQESSEDCLDKISPGLDYSYHDPQNGVSNAQKDNNDSFLSTVTENHSVLSGLNEETYPACDMNNIGTFSLDMQSEQTSKAWDIEESSFNIIISPEELLNINGNSLLNQDNFKWESNGNDDGSNSEVDGIVVPPGDLSGDEFTDTASIDSTHSQQLDQMIEDAAFLACQQDAENNNVESNIVVVDNAVNPVPNYTTFTTANTSIFTREKSLEMECRVQDIQVNAPISYYEVNSDSVICSAISEHPISKCYSSSDENLNQQSVIIEHHSVKSLEVVDASSVMKQTKKSRSRKNAKKCKQNKAPLPTENNDKTLPDVKDLTVEQVMQHPLWPQFVQKTGKVVHIFERKHSCIAAGHLKLCPDKNRKWALFSPNDSRVPRMMISLSDCPQNFYHRPQDYANVLFLAQIANWNETSTFAAGHLVKCLGNTGSIDVQTEGMLVENSVDYSEFPDEVLDCLPEGEWCVPANELKSRRDFRNECVFTIDPATARDMDDAVSCELLDNGNYAVGVHIADVTYFVEQESVLDLCAQKRATSVYLVQKVVPMLPRKLCDDLCSLSPGKDRLTFSVVWEMTPHGEVKQHWIGRSVINSCIKLSYEHAQSMIENPNKVWSSSEHPEIYGKFHIRDIAQRVNQLNSLAVLLREKRFSNGALRLDQVKLQFTLDSESGLPSGFSVFMQKDSNKLIEEFMLLANMTVAKKIYDTFPALSLLRRHPPPQMKPMQDIVSMCEAVGVILDSSSSGALQNSIAYYKGDDYLSKAKYELLMHLCSKPMKPAAYFCTGIFTEPSIFHHYALNVPIYTHFTSPIRRYPDIIVHRLLGAALHYNSPPNMSPHQMEQCAQHCNDKKYNAKKVSDLSAELFLAAFVQKLGCVHTKAMVIGVMDHSFDCLILDMGIVKRVYCDGLPLIKKQFKRSHGVSMLNLFWEDPSVKGGLEQALVIFALVDVILSATKETLQLVTTLKKPEK